MEMSVGFADKEDEYYAGEGYLCEESVLGRVYYPESGVEIDGQIAVRYMNYPWISTFEIDGIRVIASEDEKESHKLTE